MFNYLSARFKKKEIVYGGWTVLSILGFFVFQLIDNNSSEFMKSFIDLLIEPFPFIPEVSSRSSFEYFSKGYFLYQLVLFLFSFFVVIKFGPLFQGKKLTKDEIRKDIFIGLFFITCYICFLPLFALLGLERDGSSNIYDLIIYIVHSKVWMSIFYFGYFWSLHMFLLITVSNIYKYKELK